MARQDPNPAVRRAALERLGDLDLLQSIASADADLGVRAAAHDRQRSLLTGKAPTVHRWPAGWNDCATARTGWPSSCSNRPSNRNCGWRPWSGSTRKRCWPRLQCRTHTRTCGWPH
ncbi:MAG: HEAT repeat domain-containing protein [Desulfomicrobium escambiense]|nr:HEAT repeat domain-containing protein [Desulfomicrobium escambiense]